MPVTRGVLAQSPEPETQPNPTPGIKPGPHWWEATTLTTALSLLWESAVQK